MNCLESQELLQRRLDGEAAHASADLSQHLAECDTCRGLFAAAQSFQDGLRATPAPVVPPLFVARTTARVLAARKWRRVRRWAAAHASTVHPGSAPRLPTPPPAVPEPQAAVLAAFRVDRVEREST